MRQFDPEWNPPIEGSSRDDPHRGAPVLATGAPLAESRAAAVLVHGRGGSAEGILTLAAEHLPTDEVAYLAPEAAGRTWYPEPFLAPLERNEPWLTSALETLAGVFRQLGEHGFPPDRVLLGGFSQGACLALEFALRSGGRRGGLVGLSGGLIGPPGRRWEEAGSLEGTPTFLGCSDRDPHIPLERVEETARVLEAHGARVDKRIYSGMGHTVNEDEIARMRGLLTRLAADGDGGPAEGG